MSVWRRRALETFPAIHAEFELADVTLYHGFVHLIRWCREAHSSGEDAALSRIYGFAGGARDNPLRNYGIRRASRTGSNRLSDPTNSPGCGVGVDEPMQISR